MKHEVIWLSCCNMFPVHVGFCPSKKAWDKTMKHYKVTGDAGYPTKAANYSDFTSVASLNRICLITIHESADNRKRTIPQACALIAHEAMHVWRNLMEDIGQKDHEGHEIEAYGVQAIVQDVMTAYMRTRRPKFKELAKKWP